MGFRWCCCPLAIGALLGCAQAPKSPIEADAARRADSLLALNPAVEFQQALERGDLRAIGVCGFACLAEGVEGSDYDLIRGRPLNIIAGTSDAIGGPDVARLDAVADTYATRYNRLLIEHLKAHPPSQGP